MTSAVAAIAPIPEGWWIGRTIMQYQADWTWTALAFNDGTVVVLSVDEVTVGHWFEVFPLKFARSLPDYLVHHVFNWIALRIPLDVCRVSALWREEWQEAAQDHGQFMGAGPHGVQYVAPLQSAPPDSLAFHVEAGIALQGKDGSHLLVCSSDNTPFKIDFATEPVASFDDMLPLLPVFLSYVLSFIYVGIYWNKLQCANYPSLCWTSRK